MGYGDVRRGSPRQGAEDRHGGRSLSSLTGKMGLHVERSYPFRGCRVRKRGGCRVAQAGLHLEPKRGPSSW